MCQYFKIWLNIRKNPASFPKTFRFLNSVCCVKTDFYKTLTRRKPLWPLHRLESFEHLCVCVWPGFLLNALQLTRPGNPGSYSGCPALMALLSMLHTPPTSCLPQPPQAAASLCNHLLSFVISKLIYFSGHHSPIYLRQYWSLTWLNYRSKLPGINGYRLPRSKIGDIFATFPSIDYNIHFL